MLLLINAGANIYFSPEHSLNIHLESLFFKIKNIFVDCLESAAGKLHFAEKYGIERKDFFVLLEVLVPQIIVHCEQFKEMHYHSIITSAFSTLLDTGPSIGQNLIAGYRAITEELPILDKIKLQHYCDEVQALRDQVFAELARKQTVTAIDTATCRGHTVVRLSAAGAVADATPDPAAAP